MTTTVVTSDGNCTGGNPLTFDIGGCYSGDPGTLGLVFGIVCIPLWTLSQVTLYLIYCQTDGKASKTDASHVTSIVVFHWIADVLSFFGCIMTNQSSLQIYFALTSAVVHFLAIVLAILCSRKTRDTEERKIRCTCARLCCTKQTSCIAAMFICSVVSIVTVAMLRQQNKPYQSAMKKQDPLSDEGSSYSTVSPWIYIVIGYVFGAVSTGLTWLTKLREVIHFYRPHSYIYIRVVLHFVAILAEGFYVTGLLSYNQSRDFILHTLPWILARLGVAGIHVGVILQGSMLYCTWKGDVTDGGYTAILQSTTSDSDISDAERDAVTLEFPPMTCDGDGDVNRGDNSQTSEQDLGDSYAAVPSPSTSVMYNTGQKQLFRYTYCDSPADTSSEQDLEWDFECPVASKVKTPIPSSLKVTQMNKGSLKSLSSLESNSGYEKVVDWFKRAQGSDCMLYGSNETNSSYSYTS